MSRIKQFKLPDLGEGLTEGEILKWLVHPGDEVRLNQPIVEVETAKAAVEVPSPFAGVVTKLHHDEGATVDVGVPIIEFDTDPSGGPLPADVPVDPVAEQELSNAFKAAQAESAPAPAPPEESTSEGGPVLVGYGPKSTTAKRRPRTTAAPAAPAPVAEAPPAPAAPAAPAAPVVPVVPEPEPTPAPARDVSVLAKPPVRKLAKDLGVDLRALTGTGPNGTITRADVESAGAAPAEPAPAAAPAVAAPVWDASREQRVPIKGVRKHTAAAVTRSAFTAPHVSEFLTVDVTPMMAMRRKIAELPEFSGVKASPLLLLAKAMIVAVARNPMINSSWDEANQEIVVKEYVNLGIAAATPRGLIVPNIKDAGRLSLRELAGALQELTEVARAGRTTPADMQGGTITITNVGVFGVDAGTPILTPGESAILAFGAINDRPWVHEGEIQVRKVTTLALSFDHRIVDGDLGSRFLADVGAMLADPTLTFAWS